MVGSLNSKIKSSGMFQKVLEIVFQQYPFYVSDVYSIMLLCFENSHTLISMNHSLSVLESVWERSDTQAWCVWKDRRPSDDPLSGLRERRDHIFWCLEWRHLRLEGNQFNPDGSRSPWGK